MAEGTDATFDVIVVGAGQAGLGIGYYLKRDGRRFVLLERGRIGETWRSQRWDSFTLNTPNWANQLPGAAYEGAEPDGFWAWNQLVESFERYVTQFDLPIRTSVTVTAVEATTTGEGFVVHTDDAELDELEARCIVVASGILQTPNIPALSSMIPDSVIQLHTADYRSAEALPPGAVVVVGAGQSGCQIVEDLLRSSRQVYLCTSKVARLPRRYRGREILEWLVEAGFFDISIDELEDPTVPFARQPQISGVGRYGHTVSLQQLERDGATLLGRLVDVEDGMLITDDRLTEYMQFGDQKSAEFKLEIDAYIERLGLESPPLEDDPADLPAAPDAGRGAPTRLDLEEAEVATIIWCTGFTADFSWIRLPVLDDEGRPVHQRGVTSVPGLYFLGFPWLHRRKSGIILGIEDDARYLASEISRRLD